MHSIARWDGCVDVTVSTLGGTLARQVLLSSFDDWRHYSARQVRGVGLALPSVVGRMSPGSAAFCTVRTQPLLEVPGIRPRRPLGMSLRDRRVYAAASLGCATLALQASEGVSRRTLRRGAGAGVKQRFSPIALATLRQSLESDRRRKMAVGLLWDGPCDFI